MASAVGKWNHRHAKRVRQLGGTLKLNVQNLELWSGIISDYRGIRQWALRVLVADDHEIVRRGIEEILEEQPGWKSQVEAGDAGKRWTRRRTLSPT